MTVELAVPYDLETLLVDYLTTRYAERDIDATVSTLVPKTRPTNFTRIELLGGGRPNLATDRVNVALQSWGEDTVSASSLARLTFALVWALPADDEFGVMVRKVTTIGGVSFFPDPDTKLPRYQASVAIDIRPEVL